MFGSASCKLLLYSLCSEFVSQLVYGQQLSIQHTNYPKTKLLQDGQWKKFKEYEPFNVEGIERRGFTLNLNAAEKEYSHKYSPSYINFGHSVVKYVPRAKP